LLGFGRLHEVVVEAGLHGSHRPFPLHRECADELLGQRPCQG
jgi:hypothetical protein